MGIIYYPSGQIESLFGELLQFEARPTRKIVGSGEDRTIAGIYSSGAGNSQSCGFMTLFVAGTDYLVYNIAETGEDRISSSTCIRGCLREQAYFATGIHLPRLDAGSADVHANGWRRRR